MINGVRFILGIEYMRQTKTMQTETKSEDQLGIIPEHVDAFLKILARWVADDIRNGSSSKLR